MVNSVANGDNFLETLDLDRHDLGQMMGAKRKHENKVQPRATDSNYELNSVFLQKRYRTKTTLTTSIRAIGPIYIMRKKPEIMAKDRTPRIQ